MMIAELMLSIISEGLKFINVHEAMKISERILKLREGFRNEINKGSMRDDALLDQYDAELRDLGSLFLAHIKKTPSED